MEQLVAYAGQELSRFDGGLAAAFPLAELGKFYGVRRGIADAQSQLISGQRLRNIADIGRAFAGQHLAAIDRHALGL